MRAVGRAAPKRCSTAHDGAYGGAPRQVHGDVFRAPAKPKLLAVYAGTGTQLIGMVRPVRRGEGRGEFSEDITLGVAC